MRLRFDGCLEGLEKGIEILGQELGFQVSPDGMPVSLEKRPGDIEIIIQDGANAIRFEERIHFFRGLGLFIEAQRSGRKGTIKEDPQFDTNGLMLDVSRNGVLKIDSVKKLLVKLSVMGLNTIMLYAEDTYTVDSEPYFGYMRGRYSFNELKECDDYAYALGIEMIPCIQTLGHLATFLRWQAAHKYRDTESVLLAGDKETYDFIEACIKSASAPFRSKRIHIGMDEAHDLGLGRYLSMNGYRRRFDIMVEHMEKVSDITSKLGLKPMIWSDMFFRLGSKTGSYYDLEAGIPEDVLNNIPKDVQLVYWDYYHKDEEFYDQYIDRHRMLGSEPVFAGGIWTWAGFGADYGKTFDTTNAALNVCKRKGVKEVFATSWMDNGNENNHFASLLGLQLYAEHGYSKELDIDRLKERFNFCTGGDFDSFMDLRYLNETPGVTEGNHYEANPAKYLMYQDILLGLFDKHVEGLDLYSHYDMLEKKMKNHASQNSQWGFLFDVPAKLCSVLKLKSDMGLRIKKSYDDRNLEALKKIADEELPELSGRVQELRTAHRDQWFGGYKAFGWEVLDIRYGGVLTRIDSVKKRLDDYINGRISKIEELEEERLYFDGRTDKNDEPDQLCSFNLYHKIVSASPFSG